MAQEKSRKPGFDPKDKAPEEETLSAVNFDSVHEVQRMEVDAADDGGTLKAAEDSETKRTIKKRRNEEAREGKANWLKGGGPVAFLAVTIMLLGIGATVLLSPSLMLVNMKENLVNDLNDSTRAYYVFTKKVLAEQIGGSSCGEDSIRCKFSTMSPMLKERFESQGATLSASKNSASRYNVRSVSMPNGNGTARSGSELNDMATKIDDVQYRVDNVVDPKNAIFHDRKFEQRLYDRFHLPHRPEVQGMSEKDISDSFDDALKKDADYLDKDGVGVFGLEYLRNSAVTDLPIIYANLMTKPQTHLSVACGLYTYGNLIDDTVRRAKSVTLARFAMQYLAIADTIKSGNNSNYEMVISALSYRLSEPPRGSERNAFDSPSFKVPALHEKYLASVASSGISLEGGSRYMNDPTISLIALMAGVAPNAVGTEYMRGAPNSVGTNASGSTMYNKCAHGMSQSQTMQEFQNRCYDQTSYGLAPYIGQAAGSTIQQQKQPIEEDICSTPAAVITVMGMTIAAIAAEAVMFTGVALPSVAAIENARFNSDVRGVAAQDAIFAGTGIILGDVAQSIGMRPASVSSLKQYLAYTLPVERELARSQQIAASNNQFDITNRHTFVGRMASVFMGDRTRSVGSLAEAATSVLAWLPRATNMLGTTTTNAIYSQPLSFDPMRYRAAEICGLAAGKVSGINPDFACNIRYSMSERDLSMGVSDVVRYMTQSHADNARESLQEVQSRDVSAGGPEGARMQAEASQGANQAYVDNSGKPNMNTEYGKFMRYCVNREYTWGTIGMATSYTEPPYTPDSFDPFDRTRRIHSGSSIAYEDRPELRAGAASSTYGIAWGSSVDQDWLSGEKCLEESTMLSNFRAYTAMCRVLAGMSGARECWQHDSSPTFKSGFYARNNIIFTKEN